MVFGNTLGVKTDIIKRLKSRLPLHEVSSKEKCDVIIAFVPIVSRAGTDIEAALERIQSKDCGSILLINILVTLFKWCIILNTS